ncbi:hypothetical protein F3B05_25295, partial [Salmonella enterica subsp. enterica serovar Typhi]|nr:hypothetical protein [Salmonella enterica subsp. enterica serovar Typhi]
SHALDLNDMRQFAEIHDIEIAVIDNDTRLPAFKDALRWNELITSELVGWDFHQIAQPQWFYLLNIQQGSPY